MTAVSQETISSQDVQFTTNPAILPRRLEYQDMQLAMADILSSWHQSLLAHKWLDSQGQLRPKDNLAERQRLQRAHVEQLIADRQPLPTPVLGIGMFEHIEIGAGRDVVLTLAAHGIETIPAHVPLAHIEDFNGLAL